MQICIKTLRIVRRKNVNKAINVDFLQAAKKQRRSSTCYSLQFFIIMIKSTKENVQNLEEHMYF